MVVTSDQMRRVEEALVRQGQGEDILMEQAGRGIADAVVQFVPGPGTCIVYAGKGNNAGDGFVAARHLADRGWRVLIRLASERDALSKLSLRQLLVLGDRGTVVDQAPRPPAGPVVLLDGLLGTGARPGLRGPIATLCREINQLRADDQARVAALDVPTGLDSDSGECDPDAVVADWTLTIGLPKAGLFADEATSRVGRIAQIPLDDAEETCHELFDMDSVGFFMATSRLLRPALPPRPFDSHKGNYGRLGIVAGSQGFTGAAVLTAMAAVRGGAGLVTLFVPPDCHQLLATACPPEVMVRPSRQVVDDVLGASLDALAIGPGLGRDRDGECRTLIAGFPGPCVIDADAINALSGHLGLLDAATGERLLTPHPGEMARLIETQGLTRREVVARFVGAHASTLLLKGARTLTGERGMPVCANSSGSPALATGGSGDFLTGLCGAFLAAGLPAYNAACLAAWLHGRAAEIVVTAQGGAPEACLPSDLAPALGRALSDLREGAF